MTKLSPCVWCTTFGTQSVNFLFERQRTLDEDCRQAEEPKQLVHEASRFHLGRQHQHCGHLLWRFAIQQQSNAPQSGHALLTQVGSMCS